MHSHRLVDKPAYCERGANVSFFAIVQDCIFAAVAAMGFGAISDPPVRAFSRIAVLAAIGHSLRFVLMHFGCDIATASFLEAIAIGFLSLLLAKQMRVPATILYIPALLPMIPGIYAYKTVFSLIMFLQTLNDLQKSAGYMQSFFLNATVSVTVVALMVAGAALPSLIFKNKSHTLSRQKAVATSANKKHFITK